MIFGDFPCQDAEGVHLAHTLRLPQLTLKKGRVLGATDIAALRAAGIPFVTGARLSADELDEDSAARSAADLLVNIGIAAKPPYMGRCNIIARNTGLLEVDGDTIGRLNRISETITIGTLPRHSVVARDQRVATIKVIPFGVDRDVLARWREEVDERSALTLLPFRACRAALILSVASDTSPRQIDMASEATRHRLDGVGATVALELRCGHEPVALRQAIAQALTAGCDLLLVLGATISKDRADIVPAAVVSAGGVIEHFGMPVEPGNMLLLARIGDVPVLNLPGCARSRSRNGIDLVLPRLLAGLPVTPADIMGMGVGGLIRSAEEDEAPDSLPSPPRPEAPPRIAVLVLAAGRSTRMGSRNKLLCEIDGIPLVRRAVNAACASHAAQVLVVTGHEAAQVEAALVDRPVSIVCNPDYATGLSSSLRCGLRALPADTAAVVVMLADMPRVTAQDIDRLISAFDARSPAILVPEHEGRRGNPVLWPRRYFPDMMAISGDTGARGMLEQHAAKVRPIPFPDDTIFLDVDTPETLEALVRS